MGHNQWASFVQRAHTYPASLRNNIRANSQLKPARVKAQFEEQKESEVSQQNRQVEDSQSIEDTSSQLPTRNESHVSFIRSLTFHIRNIVSL